MPAQLLQPQLRKQFKALRPLALNYCALQAAAEVTREQVDRIQRRLLLEECPLYRDLEDGERVIDPRDYWLAEDEAALAAYYTAADRELRAAGIKPADMDAEFCPALVAENKAIQARRALIEQVAPMVDLDPALLWGEKEEQFFQLAMELLLKA